MTQRTATAIGFVAVLLWSTLAVFTKLSGSVPPFQLVAMSFAIGGTIGAVYLVLSGAALRPLVAVPPLAWLLGVGGLFGFHFLYFLSLRKAPAVEANLLNYTWPLLIVLLSAVLPDAGGRRGLRWWHLAGALLGLAGTVLIVADGGDVTFKAEATTGYLAAIGSALIWSHYSVLSRRFAHVPSNAVAGFCLVSSFLAALCHLAFETTSWPQTSTEWVAVAALGLGPVGLAFYVWDYGVKHGDIRVLGAAAYAAPLLSTLLLVLLGLGVAGPSLWLACALITGGAVLAAKEMLFGKAGS